MEFKVAPSKRRPQYALAYGDRLGDLYLTGWNRHQARLSRTPRLYNAAGVSASLNLMRRHAPELFGQIRVVEIAWNFANVAGADEWCDSHPKKKERRR